MNRFVSSYLIRWTDFLSVAIFKVLVPKIDSLMGKMVEVEIIECTKFSMKGKLSDQDFKKYSELAENSKHLIKQNGLATKVIQIKLI